MENFKYQGDQSLAELTTSEAWDIAQQNEFPAMLILLFAIRIEISEPLSTYISSGNPLKDLQQKCQNSKYLPILELLLKEIKKVDREEWENTINFTDNVVSSKLLFDVYTKDVISHFYNWYDLIKSKVYPTGLYQFLFDLVGITSTSKIYNPFADFGIFSHTALNCKSYCGEESNAIHYAIGKTIFLSKNYQQKGFKYSLENSKEQTRDLNLFDYIFSDYGSDDGYFFPLDTQNLNYLSHLFFDQRFNGKMIISIPMKVVARLNEGYEEGHPFYPYIEYVIRFVSEDVFPGYKSSSDEDDKCFLVLNKQRININHINMVNVKGFNKVARNTIRFSIFLDLIKENNRNIIRKVERKDIKNGDLNIEKYFLDLKGPYLQEYLSFQPCDQLKECEANGSYIDLTDAQSKNYILTTDSIHYDINRKRNHQGPRFEVDFSCLILSDHYENKLRFAFFEYVDKPIYITKGYLVFKVSDDISKQGLIETLESNSIVNQCEVVFKYRQTIDVQNFYQLKAPYDLKKIENPLSDEIKGFDELGYLKKENENLKNIINHQIQEAKQNENLIQRLEKLKWDDGVHAVKSHYNYLRNKEEEYEKRIDLLRSQESELMSKIEDYKMLVEHNKMLKTDQENLRQELNICKSKNKRLDKMNMIAKQEIHEIKKLNDQAVRDQKSSLIKKAETAKHIMAQPYVDITSHIKNIRDFFDEYGQNKDLSIQEFLKEYEYFTNINFNDTLKHLLHRVEYFKTSLEAYYQIDDIGADEGLDRIYLDQLKKIVQDAQRDENFKDTPFKLIIEDKYLLKNIPSDAYFEGNTLFETMIKEIYLNASKYSFHTTKDKSQNQIKIILGNLKTKGNSFNKSYYNQLVIEILINGKPFKSKFNKEKYIKEIRSEKGTGKGGGKINEIVNRFNGNWDIKENNEHEEFPVHYFFEFPIKF